MSKPQADPGTVTSPPSLWDLVKELNAQAGRLATLLALMLTVTTLSLAAEPLREALRTFHQPELSWLVMVGALLGINLVMGLTSVISAMGTPVLSPSADPQNWERLVAYKNYRCRRALHALGGCLWSLIAVWATALLLGPDLPSGTIEVPLRYVFVLFCAVFAAPIVGPWLGTRLSQAAPKL